MKKLFLILASLFMTCLVFSQSNPPSGLSTNTASSVTCSSFSSGSAAFNFGTPPYTGRGVCYGTSANPTIAGSKVIAPAPINANAFSVNITGLSILTKYYYRSYATNYYGTAYGPQKDITLGGVPSGLICSYYPPDTYCNKFHVVFGSYNIGCQTITDAGYVWSSTDQTPTPEETSNHIHYVTQGTGWDMYTPSVLTPNTKYYFRAWATNASGRSYSEVMYVTTCPSCDTDPCTPTYP
jgi:hypothetical protein